MTPRRFRHALQSIGLQLALTLILSGLLLALFPPIVAISAMVGGLTATLGNAVAAVVVFRAYRSDQVGSLTARMMGAELGRLVIIAVAFGVAFAYLDEPNLLALFGIFLLVHLAPLWWLHRVSDQAMTR
ncbi:MULTISPECIES: ATP synthase subunit I [unclassified Thioalkalivibrio]|uniref:ATP synthase subunit I n=1 Tax=unclassified Thioalkalivibrio TaxID=2621013 RepID=UPI000195AA12|nr:MULTISPECIES: ATP synthase subunit I [unclassified Thioalkalivibrio]ADC73083.1 ATP synthase I chain [Thioalkalivibrio sp. K90mix]